MRNIFLSLFTILLVCCSKNTNFIERDILLQKLEAFQFLSKYHHQLHIMIGEENGDINKAYKELFNAIIIQNNSELLPIKNAFERIKPNEINPNSESVKRLDYLVDYYQSGLSMQIEGIFRGHGHLDILDMDRVMDIYDKFE